MSKEDLFEPEIEAMPRPELEQLQEQRVLELIPYVYERSDFYRMHWDEAGSSQPTSGRCRISRSESRSSIRT